MKFLVIFILIFIKYCDSNDFKCGYSDEKFKSLEFYCENFQETLPVNCTTTSLYLISSCDKSKVTHLRIGGCDQDRIVQLVNDFQNIHSLDISYSGLEFLKPFDRKLDRLVNLNLSHNGLMENLREFCAKMPGLVEIDASHNEISHVSGLPNSLKRINLSYNNMSMISHYDLTNVVNLEHMDLSHNLLKEIFHRNIFSEAKHLQTLRLDGNRYRKIDRRFLQMIKIGVAVHCSWKYVTTFEIDENIGRPIRVVTTSQIEGIRTPTDMKVKLHCHVGSFEKIENFKFTENHIENISEMLRCLTPSLQQLTLSGRFTEKLNSSSIERFVNMTKLTLNDGLLTAFDFQSLKKLRKLRKLDIKNNNLKTLEGLVHNPRPYIYELNLSGNFVGHVNDSTFETYTYLRELHLRNTSLSLDNLTPFESLDRLEFLDISHNNLERTNFTSTSQMLKEVRKFYAAYCNITNVSDLLKQFGSEVMKINLAGNPLRVLKNITFENVTYLNLNLSHTDLSHVDFSFENLWILDVSHNSLKSVNLTMIRLWLMEVHLNGNELTEVDQFTQSQFPAMNRIAISHNQIPCKHLARFINEWPNWKLAGNPLEQKFGDCSHAIRLMNNLGFVGDLITDLS